MAGEPSALTAPSVRWIRGAAALVRRQREATLAAVALFVIALSAVSGLYAVENGESAALLRFGKLVDDGIGPGLHVRLPWGIDTIQKFKTGEVLRMEVEGDFEKELQLISGDENFIDLTTVVQYKVTGLGRYLLSTEDPTQIVGQTVRAGLAEAVAGMPVDDVLTSGKAEIQNRVRSDAQAMLDAHDVGVTLVSINLQSVNPPAEAAAAFRKVNDAKAEAARAVNDAHSEAEKSLNLASGEAGKLVHETTAMADARRRDAEGRSQRFATVAIQHRTTPDLARTDIYHDVVRRVLGRARLVFLAPGETPKVDVQLVDRAASAPAATPAPTPAPSARPVFPPGPMPTPPPPSEDVEDAP